MSYQAVEALNLAHFVLGCAMLVFVAVFGLLAVVSFALRLVRPTTGAEK
ncbi:hypothetical protein [Acidovorax sp. K2F]|nr:hypothetical protein [Acidovorax sp. K2F]MCT6717864.1 hypothetical protein [Acidovorax sp. K2F]